MRTHLRSHGASRSPGARTGGSSRLRRAWALAALSCVLAAAPLAAGGAPTPMTGELPVNTTEATGEPLRPAAAMDAAGNAVVAWESGGQVRAQRFDSAGVAVEGELQVSTAPVSTSARPDVAMDPSGSFVVVWQQDAGRLHAQRFDAAGAPAGEVLLVDATEPACGAVEGPARCFRYEGDAAVAADATGGFVVAYGGALAGEGSSVFARRFDGAGRALDERRIRVTATPVATAPVPLDVARSGRGTFVIAWEDGAAGDFRVAARRFDAAGRALDGAIRVDSGASSAKGDPAVAIDASGAFVVAWTSVGQETPLDPHACLSGVYAQRFDAGGEKLGGELLVNTHTAHHQVFPDVAMDPHGRFAVAWSSYGQEDPSSPDFVMYGVYAQAFSSDGSRDGGELHVNVSEPHHQRRPSVALAASGSLMFAWHGEDGPPDVLARWYSFPRSDGVCAGRRAAASACGTELMALCSSTESATSLAEEDRRVLLASVFGAVDEVEGESPPDASRTLSELASRLAALERGTSPRIGPADAAAIRSPLRGAHSCVRRLLLPPRTARAEEPGPRAFPRAGRAR
jgi:hypothetical protein